MLEKHSTNFPLAFQNLTFNKSNKAFEFLIDFTTKKFLSILWLLRRKAETPLPIQTAPVQPDID